MNYMNTANHGSYQSSFNGWHSRALIGGPSTKMTTKLMLQTLKKALCNRPVLDILHTHKGS